MAENTAIERPILFSAPMVRALLAGTKTETRRVMKRQKQHDFTDYTLFGQQGHPDDEAARCGGWAEPWVAIEHAPDWPDGKENQCSCPHARRRGDWLWVRETHFINDYRRANVPAAERKDCEIHYRADPLPCMEGEEGEITWTPSIHMPRWASRIRLEVTQIRVQRLQEITEADAQAEGAEPNDSYAGPEKDRHRGWRHGYRILWEQINGAGSWAVNPWVWAIEFKRIKP
jgi:hypothetical protein